jgi:hypothetical protein
VGRKEQGHPFVYSVYRDGEYLVEIGHDGHIDDFWFYRLYRVEHKDDACLGPEHARATAIRCIEELRKKQG